jgi:methyl-accepting chemotaxis protein
MLANLRWTIGRKLALSFAAVVGIFVVALLLTVRFDGKAQDEWRTLLRWDRGYAGVQQQVEGTRTQMAAQALYAATFDPRYKAEWEHGVEVADAGAKAAEVVADPTITKIARAAQAADHLHDDNVHKRLFPAVARGDHAAALRALEAVDRYVRVPLGAQKQIASYVARRRARATAAADSAASRARTVAYFAIALGALLAAAIATLFGRSLVRRIREISAATRALAVGDVAHEVNIKGGDELATTGRAYGDLQASLRDLAGAAERVAGGDLTVEVEPRSDGDVLGHAFRTMVQRLRQLVERMSSSATSLGAASHEMVTTSEEAGRAVGEIAHAVTEVATGAERQVRAVTSARVTTEQVAAATSSSADEARETAAAAEETRRVADEGSAAVGQATEAMAIVRDSASAVGDTIRGLSAKSTEIDGIVGTITALADQTNLLALNAAIEAARAGEQGRGFAVVAEEVRKLAEESGQAAASIAALVAEIQGETARAVQSVEDGAQRTEEGAATVEQARESFNLIGERVADMNARAERIAAAVAQIATGAQGLHENMAEVAAVAEQSSASSQQVSASTEQTSASAQQVAASAQEVARTAEELGQLVATFKL